MENSKLGTAQILPPDAVRTLVNAAIIATQKPEGTLSRASCIDVAIATVRLRYPEYFKRD